VTGEWRRLHNEELYDPYCSPNVIRVIISRRMRWSGHVACMGERRGVYRVLVGRPEGRRQLGRPEGKRQLGRPEGKRPLGRPEGKRPLGRPEGKNHLGDPGVDGRIILKCTLKK
jgi:hypothetical protein